ncbi:MAG: phosphodiester glycosidase family protein [Agathobacter sp.]|nr:phosphodiester glycosidase family protein [Agathobacter sp.]
MKIKKHLWGLIYGCLLICFTVYVLLDTFVIPREYVIVDKEDSNNNSFSDEVIITDNSYSDENISITITEYREHDTNIYVAEVILSSPEFLQTAFAKNAYGRNVTQKTSEMAEANNAIFAVNGDYYGARETGLVVRDGVIYRDSTSRDRENLVIYADGSLDVITERGADPEKLVEDGALHILSFGPGLVVDGEIAVSKNEEVGQAMASNPRTAIGIIDDLHYIFVVSDGRTDESEGLSLYELATFMDELGVQVAYNLDGGGSSTMWFNGKIINVPMSSKGINKERSVSDIVYIGY